MITKMRKEPVPPSPFTMILWTSIGVGILYSHRYFERWSPLIMIIAQYIIAMGLVFGTMFVESHFTELHPMAYRDAFRSFTIPYIIGAIIYYVSIFREAKQQNDLLQEIKNKSLETSYINCFQAFLVS